MCESLKYLLLPSRSTAVPPSNPRCRRRSRSAGPQSCWCCWRRWCWSRSRPRRWGVLFGAMKTFFFHIFSVFLLGQSCTLHATLSSLSPKGLVAQSSPSPTGAGLVQVRVLLTNPGPQVVEQGPEDHSDQPPLTTEKNK